MTQRPGLAERWAYTGLFAIALASFFFPIVAVRLPIVGELSLSPYDVVRRAVDASTARQRRSDPKPPTQTPYLPRSNQLKSPMSEPMPGFAGVSAGLFPVWMLIAYLGALGGVVVGLRGYAVPRSLATVALAASVVAIVHIAIADSELRSTMLHNLSELKDNPFAGIAHAMVQGVGLAPGVGLWGMAGCLLVAAFVCHTRILWRDDR